MKKLNVGGQAVIEGVMIRSPNYLATSIRKKNKIKSKKEKLMQRSSKILKFPFIRGVVNLVDMLVIGIKSLSWSANQAAEEGEELGKYEVAITLGVSFIFAILFFVGLPYLLTILLGIKEETKPLLFNLIDGFIRMLIFLAYVAAISFMKDVRRVFQYHGAEHKAVHCYEAGEKLNVKNAKKYSILHARCGTSFIMFVFVISILLFSVLPSMVNWLYPVFASFTIWAKKLILFPLRILLIPFIAGVSYEILKLSDKFKENRLIRIITLPGLALQKLTAREPDKKQLEVAIASLNAVLALERKK